MFLVSGLLLRGLRGRLVPKMFVSRGRRLCVLCAVVRVLLAHVLAFSVHVFGGV